MFNGRHCVENDYLLLENETSNYILLLQSHQKEAYEEALENFIDLVKQFDDNIGEKLKSKILQNIGNDEVVISIVKTYIGELKNNVLVDIKEHH